MYNLYDDARCGYDSYNECGTFLDAVLGEEDYDYDKVIPYSMVGKFREVNKATVD